MELVQYTENIMDESLKYTKSYHIWKAFGYKKIPNSNKLQRYILRQKLIKKEDFLRNEIFLFTFILMVINTPNLRNRNKVFKYYLDILNMQDLSLVRNFGFKSHDELSWYHYSGIQDYLEVKTDDFEELVKIFSRRFKTKVCDFSYEYFYIHFGAYEMLDLKGLEVYLDRLFGDKTFTDEWKKID